MRTYIYIYSAYDTYTYIIYKHFVYIYTVYIYIKSGPCWVAQSCYVQDCGCSVWVPLQTFCHQYSSRRMSEGDSENAQRLGANRRQRKHEGAWKSMKEHEEQKRGHEEEWKEKKPSVLSCSNTGPVLKTWIVFWEQMIRENFGNGLLHWLCTPVPSYIMPASIAFFHM